MSIPDSTKNATGIYHHGRLVASVRDGILRRTLQGSKHFLFGDSIAFAVEVLKKAEALGARKILVKDSETNLYYKIDLATFKAKAFTYNSKAYGAQLACSLAHWKCFPVGGYPKPQPVQMPLFEKAVIP